MADSFVPQDSFISSQEQDSFVPQDSFAKTSVLENIKQHPIKAFFGNLPETLGGKSPKQVLADYEQGKIDKAALQGKAPWLENYLRSATVSGMGDVGNIFTTPATYVGIPGMGVASRTIGKIPWLKTGLSLGDVATKVPFGLSGFEKEGIAYQQALKKFETSQSFNPLAQFQTSPISAIDKITQALKEAKPIRGQQEALYTAERIKRVGEVIQAGQIPGEQGYFAQLGALKGAMPKVQFEGIRPKVTQLDIDSLFSTVESHATLTPFDKVTAKTGLAKLLGEAGGSVPTENELKLLSEVFPKDFINTVSSKQPLLQKVGQATAEVLNIPRALMASFDMSAPLRQGAFLVGRPNQFLPAFRDMFKYFFSEKAYQGLMQNIELRPSYALMKESGLPLTNIGKSLTSNEEAFMSNLPEKIPGIGHMVRASNRAYVGFLNKLRADTFDSLVNTAKNQGINITEGLTKDIATFVGSATGRGKLGALERSAVTLNSIFFSPRLMASRFNLLNPQYYVSLDPFVRKEALKSLFTFAGTGLSILSLAKMGGAEVSADPRNSDFGKIKIGNTRYDPWGGFQQYIKLGAQMITGQLVNSTTGVVATVGEGYKPVTRMDILQRFSESKTAPVTSFAIGLLKGQTTLGQPMDIKTEVASRFIPMVLQDMSDLYKERGFEGLPMGIPGVFGVGVQTYAPTPSQIVSAMNSVVSHAKEFLKEGRVEEAKNLITQNIDTIKKGKMFEPLQQAKSKLTSTQDIINKNILVSSEVKKEKLSLIEEKMNQIKVKEEEQQAALRKHGATVTTIDNLFKSRYFNRLPSFMQIKTIKDTTNNIKKLLNNNS